MQDANFRQWLDVRGYDSQQWSPELLAMLKRRYRSEQIITSTVSPSITFTMVARYSYTLALSIWH